MKLPNKIRRIPFFGRRLASLEQRIKLRGYRPDMYDAEELEQRAASGLDFTAGASRLAEVTRALELPDYDPARDSVHWLLAGCVEQRLQPRRILELGTFTGQFTAILAKLFPDAEISTVDLPPDDPLLRGMYGRKKAGKLERELAQRAKYLAHPNIVPIACNTFFLLDAVKGPFDLIWVDAGHRFPDVAWDLCNAYHLTRPGGVLMADDVTLDPNFTSKTLGPDSVIVLQYLAERRPVSLHYFLKRRNVNNHLHQRKYVAWLMKPDTH
jgi:predicted O-methyltransferase YrrM